MFVQFYDMKEILHDLVAEDGGVTRLATGGVEDGGGSLDWLQVGLGMGGGHSTGYRWGWGWWGSLHWLPVGLEMVGVTLLATCRVGDGGVTTQATCGIWEGCMCVWGGG